MQTFIQTLSISVAMPVLTITLLFLWMPFLALASVVVDTGCAVVVSEISNTELVVKAVVPTSDSPLTQAGCDSELTSSGITTGSVIAVDPSDRQSIMSVVDVSQAFALPVSHFSGTMGEDGPVPGGYEYNFLAAYPVDTGGVNDEAAADDGTGETETPADAEPAAEEKRGLQLQLIELLQRLIGLLVGTF